MPKDPGLHNSTRHPHLAHKPCGMMELNKSEVDQVSDGSRLPEQNGLWPRFCPVLVYLVPSWLTSGHGVACWWLRSGEQDRTTQVQSFHAVLHSGIQNQFQRKLTIKSYCTITCCIVILYHIVPSFIVLYCSKQVCTIPNYIAPYHIILNILLGVEPQLNKIEHTIINYLDNSTKLP